MIGLLIGILLKTWDFTKEASPWLLLGFLFAGLLKTFVPSELLFKYLGSNKLRSILMATLIGIPLPLCSCGVIPTGLSLYEHGASRASTLSFLIATPATTVTAIFLTFGMLGWRFALAEVLLCFGVAIITGLFVDTIVKNGQTGRALKIVEQAHENKKIKTILQYGFIDMVDDVGLYILIGLFGAGIVAVFAPSNLVVEYLSGPLSLIAMVLIATPMYICSTASVPFVASLIAKGMNPAAGLVVLTAGPATNIATVLAIGKTMGKETALFYVSSIVIFSVLIAYGFDLAGLI